MTNYFYQVGKVSAVLHCLALAESGQARVGLLRGDSGGRCPSHEARIAVQRGDLDAAVKWQRGFRMPPHVPGMIFFLSNPWITECRISAATGTDTGLANACEKLQYLRQETESVHYTCQTVEIVVLLAMVAHRQGREDEASDFLQHAVKLAEPEEWVRPFVESGQPMGDFLRQLLKRDATGGHARKVLAVFDDLKTASPRPQALTHR